MRLITEPDFITKSSEGGIFSEETKLDVSIKRNYVYAHLANLKELQKDLKMGKAVEKLEHGRINNKTQGQNRCLNSRSWATLIAEIGLMEQEHKRLTALYNA